VRGNRSDEFFRLEGIWLHADSTPDDWRYPSFMENRRLKREWSKVYCDLPSARSHRRRRMRRGRPMWQHLLFLTLSVGAVVAAYLVTKRQ
jgi:hypothetical protein